MRLPPSVRYLPSRLQFVFNPWLWLGLLITGTVGIYAWEYRRNPGRIPWQFSSTGQNIADNAPPINGGIDSLTPEEQAVAAELDNIELLLNQLESDVSLLTSGGDSSAAAALNAALAQANGEVESESPVERLNRYVDEYNFSGGTTNRSASPDTASTADGGQKPASDSVLSVKPFLATTPETSALSQSASRPQAQAGSTDAAATGATAISGTEQENAEAGATFSFEQSQPGVIPGSLDGLDRAFIRTTPNMSPPPGTTGYVPPASLPVVPAEPPGTNSFASPAATAPSLNNSGPTPSDRSQVLPPPTNSVVTPLEIPTVDGSTQVTPQQPRNVWESFFD